MLRATCSALYRCALQTTRNVKEVPRILPYLDRIRQFSGLSRLNGFSNLESTILKPLSIDNKLLAPVIASDQSVPSRSVTKFSLRKGKRKSVKTVLRRFFRLHWGGWVRTIAGRHRKMWKKSAQRRKRIRRHVLCNSTQSWLLDSMVTKYWRKPKYYVDDPYEMYHTREEFPITRKKPIVRD